MKALKKYFIILSLILSFTKSRLLLNDNNQFYTFQTPKAIYKDYKTINQINKNLTYNYKSFAGENKSSKNNAFIEWIKNNKEVAIGIGIGIFVFIVIIIVITIILVKLTRKLKDLRIQVNKISFADDNRASKESDNDVLI